MKHFLVIFDRALGRVISTEEFDDRRNALRARFSAERQHSGSRNVEIVVLGASSRPSLEKTHSRYFVTASRLAKAGASKLPRKAEATTKAI